ncbi:MAG: hypothetical protein GY811_02100 [Myxococcales bacterium]|nr:hypothetical protein [Myxococcales bacterium]
MENSHAEIFSSLRIVMIDTLVESHHSIDDAFGTLPLGMIRGQFKTVVDQMHKYLQSPSPAHLYQSVSTWTATLLGVGLSPRSVLRTVVTMGDLVVQAAKRELPSGPATNLFLRELVRLNFNAAREVVAIFNDELEEQRAGVPSITPGEAKHAN